MPARQFALFMKDTDKKAKAGMMKFVALIFAIALVIAGVYFLFLTPGEPEGQPSPHAIDQEGQ